MTDGRVVVLYDATEKDPAIFRDLRATAGRAVEVIGGDADFLLVKRHPIGGDRTTYRVRRRQVEPLSDRVTPRRSASDRAIVYLDQCVLSDIAKQQRGGSAGPRKEAIAHFVRVLDRAVLTAETAICLETYLHRVETSALLVEPAPKRRRRSAQDLRQRIATFLDVRTRRLRTLPGDTMLQFQANQRVAMETDALVLPSSLLWKTGLSRDPNVPNAKTGLQIGGAQFVITTPWRETERPTPLHEDLERRRSLGEFGTFEQELEKSRQAWRAKALRLHSLVTWGAGLLQQGRTPSAEAFDRFITSDAFFELPCVLASTRIAADILSDKHRKFGRGDLADLQAAAWTVPYAHLMVVDGNMAERIRRLKLDTHFDTAVFPASSRGLKDAASWLDSRRGTE